MPPVIRSKQGIREMTFADAHKLLPKFARGLAPHAVTIIALRDAVSQEIQDWRDGKNPLTRQQVDGLLKFLDKTY